MNVPAKLATFGAALVVAFGAAAGAGAVLDPTDDGTAPAHGDEGHGRDHPGMAGAAPAATGALPGGLSASQDGYTLVPRRTAFVAGRPGTLRFAIVGPDGRPVTRGYELESERELHLIVVRRDATGFQHLHPRRAADGVWSVTLTLPTAGSYRILADATIAGTRRTLGVDVDVPGDFRPAAPAAPSRSASADGFGIALDAGALRAGRESPLRFRIARGGEPARDLQPYLGAAGHLVALREGDLAYLHVHPDAPGRTGEIPFAAEFPSAGRYHLFLQFRADGVVHTAPLTVEVAR